MASSASIEWPASMSVAPLSPRREFEPPVAQMRGTTVAAAVKFATVAGDGGGSVLVKRWAMGGVGEAQEKQKGKIQHS